MEELHKTFMSLADKTDLTARRDLIDGLRKMANDLEAPDDTLQRLMYLVSDGDTERPVQSDRHINELY